MKPQALVVLLLAAALVVVGYFVLREGDEVAPANLPGGTSVSANDGAGGPVDAERVAGAGKGQDSNAASEVAVDRTAAPDVTPTEASAKGCMLRGRIVDLDGEPRGGLALSIDTWGSDTMVEITPMPGGRNEVRKEVTTAADGTFRAQLAAKRQGTISLPDDDLVFAERLRFSTAAAEQDLGDLVVVRSARLAGLVQDEGGKPVAGVMVAAELGAMGFDVQSSTKSGDDGTFSVGKLRSGDWVLTTRSSLYLPSSRKLKLADEQQMTDLVIVVKSGRSIAGRVLDERGVGVAGMKVASQRKTIVGGVDIQRFTTDEAAVTDKDGNFRLGGLEGNTVAVRVTGPGHSKLTKGNIKTGTNNVELRVERLGSIHGVLVTADGTPVVGSSVSARTQGASNGAVELAEGLVDFDLGGSAASATTDDEGKFVIESVKPGLVTVKARGKAHLPVDQAGVQVRAAQAVRGIRLVADAGAIARIHIVDLEGEAIVGADVTIRPAPKPATPGFRMSVRANVDDEDDVQIGRKTLGTGVTGEDGIATIMGLPGGDVVVSALHADYAPSGDTQVAMPETGVVDRQLTMAPPSFVEVVVTNTDGSVSAGTDVLLEVPGVEPSNSGMNFGDNQGLVGSKTTDAEGKVRFGPVGAGEYVVSLSRGKKARGVGGMMVFVGNENDKIVSSAKQFAVAAGKTATVALKKPILTRLTGVVMGSDGPVVGCGVELQSAADDTGIAGLGGTQERTKQDGSFVFEAVESGDYILRFGKSDQIVKARHELTVPANTPELHQDLTLRTGTVRVLVLSKEDAEPVERAEVRLTRGGDSQGSGKPQRQTRVMMIGITNTSDGASEEASTMTFGQERVLTDEDGIAEFTDVPVGDYTLKVESRRYSPAEKGGVSVVELQLTDCGTIELSGAGQIRGVVKNAAGKPTMAMVERRVLGAADWGDSEMAMRGNYRLTGIAPGTYEVRARAVGPNPGEPSEPKVVEVKAGKTEEVNLSVK